MEDKMKNNTGYVPSVFDVPELVGSEESVDKINKLQDKVTEYKAKSGQLDAADYINLMKRVKTKQLKRDYKKIGRNEPCPCGATDENNKPVKYKNCCLKTGKYETYSTVE